MSYVAISRKVQVSVQHFGSITDNSPDIRRGHADVCGNARRSKSNQVTCGNGVVRLAGAGGRALAEPEEEGCQTFR